MPNEISIMPSGDDGVDPPHRGAAQRATETLNDQLSSLVSEARQKLVYLIGLLAKLEEALRADADRQTVTGVPLAVRAWGLRVAAGLVFLASELYAGITAGQGASPVATTADLLATLIVVSSVVLAVTVVRRVRDHGYPLPMAPRAAEVILVAVLGVLRYEGLRTMGATAGTATIGAFLASGATAAGFLVFEVAFVHTRPFAVSGRRLQASLHSRKLHKITGKARDIVTRLGMEGTPTARYLFATLDSANVVLSQAVRTNDYREVACRISELARRMPSLNQQPMEGQ